MATDITSKHALVARAPSELYMAFTDMRNFVNFLPEDKKDGVTADFDSLSATVQGFNLGVKVAERNPYSNIRMVDNGGPFPFNVTLHFDGAEGSTKTDFHIDFSAELNLMMKMVLGSKIQDALDKMVDALACVSEGKMPEGIDPEMLKNIKF
ncbi:MAG: hypothetical protein WCS67_00175 [Bacteroidales bacterium]